MVPPGADEKRYHNQKTDFKFQNKLQIFKVSKCRFQRRIVKTLWLQLPPHTDKVRKALDLVWPTQLHVIVFTGATGIFLLLQRAPLLHNSSKERPVGSIWTHSRSSWKDIYGPCSNWSVRQEAFLRRPQLSLHHRAPRVHHQSSLLPRHASCMGSKRVSVPNGVYLASSRVD